MPPRMRRPVQREDRPAEEITRDLARAAVPVAAAVQQVAQACAAVNDAITNTTWNAWNHLWTETTTGTGAGTITYATADQVWRAWNFSAGTGTITTPGGSTQGSYEAYQEQMRAQAERARVQAAALVEERHRKFRTAEALLLEWLDEEQIRSYQTDRYFLVRGSDGGLFQIHCNSSCQGNIVRLQEQDGWGTPLFSICMHPSGLPLPDAWLAQKLMIETDEPMVNQIGNRNSVYGQSRVRLPREDDVIMEITFTEEETEDIMVEERSDRVPHGTLAGYISFGCRCMACLVHAPVSVRNHYSMMA